MIPIHDMRPLKSSAARHAGYCHETKCVEVVYPNGQRYRFLDVPESEFDALMKSPSVGRHLAEMKGKYETETVG